MIGQGTDNPWHIQSIYDLQYFICPSCVFKDHSKQEFINHVYKMHPNSVEHLFNIQDDSLTDVIFPNTIVKEELNSETDTKPDFVDPKLDPELIEVKCEVEEYDSDENKDFIENDYDYYADNDYDGFNEPSQNQFEELRYDFT